MEILILVAQGWGLRVSISKKPPSNANALLDCPLSSMALDQ